MSRLRAVEHGRDVLVAATSGISAVSRRRQRSRSRRRRRSRAPWSREVPLRDGRTLATRLGGWPERVLAVAGLLAAAVGRVLRAVADVPRTRHERSSRSTRRASRRTRAGGLPADVTPAPACWSSSRPTTSASTSRTSSAGSGPPSRGATCSSSTTRSPDGTGDLADRLAAADDQRARAAPARQAGPRRGLPGRLRLGPRARLRRPRRDGRRRVAPARAAAAAARRPARTPTSCWARAGCRADRWSTGRGAASCCRGAATAYVRIALGLDVRDATGGFRAFRRTHAGEARPGRRRQRRATASRSTWRGGRRSRASGSSRCRSTFVERVRGESKMSGAIVREALWRVTVWGVQQRGSAGCAAGAAREVRRDGRCCSWSLVPGRARSSRST